MGKQSGGFTRFDGPGSLWKSSWKGRRPFSEFCCFEGFDRDANWYEEAGGALDIVPANGAWINALVTIPEPLPIGAPALIARNGGDPDGWEILADGFPTLEGSAASVFTFRVYDGATVTASSSVTVNYDLSVFELIDSLAFRISAFFLPPDGFAPNGELRIFAEGERNAGPDNLFAPYVNANPILVLGAGVGAEEDWLPAKSICGLAGGEGEYDIGTAQSAHDAWKDEVRELSEMLPLSGEFAISGYTFETGWRGNNPYLPAGTAPDPLAAFGGDAPVSLTVGGSPGNALAVGCGTLGFAEDFITF